MRDKAIEDCTLTVTTVCEFVWITTGQPGIESLMKSVINESAWCSLKLSWACLFQSTTHTTDTSHRLSFYCLIWTVVEHFIPWNPSLYFFPLWFSHSDRLPSLSLNKNRGWYEASHWQKREIMKRPWLHLRDIFANISTGRLYLKAYEYWQGPAFFLYHITSLRIDPVKQLELLDLISQTDAVTLCWQIKIQINLPCVKRKRAERGSRTKSKKDRERGR